MGETVPLSRILQMHYDRVVVDDIGELRVLLVRAVGEVRLVVAQRRPQHRRMPARVEHVAARVIERQAQAEGESLAHGRDALLDLLGAE